MNQMKAPLHEFALRLISNGEVQYFLNGLLDLGHPVAQDLEQVKAKRGQEMNDAPEYPRNY